jgi:iron complex outermembrane receptor protein
MSYLAFRSAILAAGSLIAWTTSASAIAQDAGTQQTGAAPNTGPAAASSNAVAMNGQLEEIIVTARRSEERAQSVPLTVSALTPERLRNATIQSGLDLQKLVPTLSVVRGTSASAADYSLRGVRTGVVTYFNEAPSPVSQAGSSAVSLQLFDLASVQAISGPQGTLFGRNSTGGAILFVPQKPTDQFGGYIEGEFGDYVRREATAVLNIPLADFLKLRFDGQVTRRGGVVKNVSGRDEQDIDTDAFRVGALLTPTDRLTNYLLIDYGYSGGAQYAGIGFFPKVTCPANFAACFYPVAALNAAQAARGVRKADSPFPEKQKDKEFGLQDVVSYDIGGGFSLKYIGSYRTSRSYHLHNQVSFPIRLIYGQDKNYTKETTQELQLHGDLFDNRFVWVVGGFYRHTNSDGLNAYQIFQPFNAGDFDLMNSQSSPVQGRTTSEAVYGQGTFHVTDALSLTGGVRYTHDRQSAIYSSRVPGGGCGLSPLVPGVDVATCTQPQSGVFQATTYTFSADYKFSSKVLVYATTRTGYNAGGFNQGLRDPAAASYKPEHLRDYEAGLKADWMIGSVPVRTNLSGFYGKYRDIQRSVVKFFDNLAFAGTFNAAAATIYGSQFEFLVRPVKPFDISGSVGYLHTKYDRFAANSLQADATGNRFAQAPSWTANVSATFHQDIGPTELVANANYAYLSSVTFTDTNVGNPYAFQKGYGLLDIRADLRHVAGSRIDVGAYVKNLTNKIYAVNISDQSSSLGYVSTIYGDPRTYGVDVRINFGPH